MCNCIKKIKRMGYKLPNKNKEINNRNKILKAASEEFIEYGFYGARTRRIAQRANINKAMIHYYFSTKENIYREVLQSVFNLLIEKLNTIKTDDFKNETVEAKMRQIIDVYTEIFTNYSSYMKLLIYEVITGGKFLPQIIIKNINKIPINPFTGKLYKYFKEQIKAGNIRKLNILQMLISLISQIVPVYIAKPVVENILKNMGIRAFVLNKFINERKEFVMDILKNGIFTKKVNRRK